MNLKALIERTEPSRVYVNFPYAKEGGTVRYQGEAITPYAYHSPKPIAYLIEYFEKIGFVPSGETNWGNVDVEDKYNNPHQSVPMTRGRLLLERKE